MDDDQKKPPRKGPPRRGPSSGPGGRPARRDGKDGPRRGPPSADRPAGKPFRPRPKREDGEGERKPFRSKDGERKPFRKDGERPLRKPREGDAAASAERPARREYRPRPDGERKPYRPDGERKPFRKDGDRPERSFRPRPPRDGADAGERPRRAERPFRKPREGDAAASAERPARREYRPRPDGERKPYRPDGERKPFRQDGERSFRPRPTREGGEGDAAGSGERPARREYRPRADGERKPHRPDGERKPFRKDGDRPFRARDGDRPFTRKPDRERRPEGDGATESGQTEPNVERIARRLARAGLASRREAEDLVTAGRVRVNGKVIDTPAFNVSATDAIEIDGTALPPVERTRLFLFHKPAGVVTTNRDPEGRRTVFDVLPSDLPRLITVGRLDINTEGLLLLTNDGGLSRTLELPATGWLRRYRVRVHGKVDESALAALRDGTAVDGVYYGSVEATLDREQGSNAWLTLGLREGKNREVKNILGALGLDVTRLIRISFGPFQLGELPEGHVLEIKGRMLREQLGERLIEESGADFDAAIVKPFSNKPQRRERDGESTFAAERKAAKPRPLEIGEGGLIKRRKMREESRDRALDRLTTKPERGERQFRSERPAKGERPARGEDRPPRGKREPAGPEPRAPRRTNVWMAPGARPQGAAAAAPKKPAGKPRAEGSSSGPGKGGPRKGGPAGGRPGKGGPRADRRR